MQPARLCFRSAGRPSRCSPRPSARPRRLRRGDATRSPARCGPGAIGRRRCELRRRAPGSLFPPGGAEINFCAAGDMSKKKGLSFEEKRVRMMEIFFETKDVFQLKDIEKIAPKEKGITSVSVKEILQSLVDDGMVDTDRIGTSNYFWAFPSKALHARKRKLEDLESQELSSLLLIGVGKHLFISLFATGVHDKKINKLALWSDCTTTLPAFPTLMSHIPLCPFIKESFELMQNAFLETLFSSGVVLESLLLSYFAESSQKKETLQKSIEKSKIGRENTAERAALIEELAALRQKKEQLKAEIEKYRECDPDVIEEMLFGSST
ncbi:meiotic nuclear division protein 1 homolog isoform X2 [Columba livia]|uniref:meiotic nuclear division protein 1 homolog isoform X2 n=1 Tax=Columba livia TaxID=8932 RepID=UPI0031B9EE91